jgi:hypothetical protein
MKFPKTLLGKFLVQRISNFQEAVRKGTPKGEPIGFFRDKYFASLLMITSYRQKQIAKIVGVSHGLLRNWNTQKDFKKMVEKHCLDFALLFSKRMEKRIEESDKEYEKFLEKPIGEIAESKPPFLDYNEFSDARDYGDLLLSIILKTCKGKISEMWENVENMDAVKKMSTVRYLMEWMGVVHAMKSFEGISESEAFKKQIEELRREFLKFIIELSKALLLEPSMTVKGKKMLISVLMCIGEAL